MGILGDGSRGGVVGKNDSQSLAEGLLLRKLFPWGFRF